jgi:phospholipase D1/2
MNQNQGKASCQIVRSVSKWSIGATDTEASIAEAYTRIIRESEHFVYIENQFFITATGDQQKPVKNLIGAAIVERILRAARAGEKYQMIVVIPSVPGFAGDLHDEGSLGTRAIMEFQYFSINRGGHSIMEKIAKAGFNPMEYIRFYNLRNYDRLNVSGAMKAVEKASGVSYGQAQHQYNTATTGPKISAFDTTAAYPQYQQHAPTQSGKGRWDTVSECYMLGGQDIRNVPWEHGGSVDEIDAFVSEELYIHSKVCISVS